MNRFNNLPPEQRATQRVAEQFNADERLWEKLEPGRRLRRKLRPKLSKKKQRALDLQEFAQARRPRTSLADGWNHESENTHSTSAGP